MWLILTKTQSFMFYDSKRLYRKLENNWFSCITDCMTLFYPEVLISVAIHSTLWRTLKYLLSQTGSASGVKISTFILFLALKSKLKPNVAFLSKESLVFWGKWNQTILGESRKSIHYETRPFHLIKSRSDLTFRNASNGDRSWFLYFSKVGEP